MNCWRFADAVRVGNKEQFKKPLRFMKEVTQNLRNPGMACLAHSRPEQGDYVSAAHMRQDGLAQLTAEVDRIMQRDYAGLWEQRPRLFRLAINEAASLAWLTDVPELVFPTLAQEKIQALAHWHCRQESLLRRGTTSVPSVLRDACCRARICPAEWPAAPCRQSAWQGPGRWEMTGRKVRLSNTRV